MTHGTIIEEMVSLIRGVSSGCIVAISISCLSFADAQVSKDRYEFHIETGTLGSALEEIVETTEVQLLYPHELSGKTGFNPVVGQYTIEEAIGILLGGTKFSGGLTTSGVIVIALGNSGQPQERKANMPIGENSKRKALLAGAAALVLGNQQAMAQSAGETTVAEIAAADENLMQDTIVVRGIRKSLTDATAIKRNANGVVDAISAEDIGKFPDQNVAESLQRIPGVSIDRSSGEGQRITVRGFGPEFNAVLVNGRTMATENVERDFSFDTLASELISGTEVYKTYSASLPDGGIGATVNVKTARPFDIDGFKFAASAKGLYEELADEITPQVSGLVSNTLADGKVGILVALSHQERNARIDQVNYRGFRTNVDLSAVGGVENSFIQQTNDQIVDYQDRTRTGGTAVFQWAPADQFQLTADVIYSDFNVESDAATIGHWVTPAEITSARVDENNTVVEFTHSANGATDFVARSFNRPTETFASGLDLEWQVSDTFELALDVSQSTAESKNGGNDIFAVIGFNNGVTQINEGGPIKVQGIPELSPSLGRSHISNRQGLTVKDEITEIKLDGKWDVSAGILDSVNFGVSSHSREKSNTNVRTRGEVQCLYCGYAIDVPDQLLSPFTPSGFLSSEDTNGLPTSWLKIDSEAYFEFMESAEAAAALDEARGNPVGTAAEILTRFNGFAPQKRSDSFSIEDKVISAYTELAFSGELGAMPWSANLGLRYAETEMTASGSQVALLELREIPDDPTLLQAVFTDDDIPVSETNEYSNVLPTFNFKLNLTDSLITRLAYSETVTRPTFRNLAPRVSYDVLSPNGLRASAGNPALDPFESQNLDLALEWYFGDASYLSAAYFTKSVDNFIVSGIRQQSFTNPTSGAVITPADGSSPVWDVAGVVNSTDALEVDGLEIAYQQTFDMLPGLWSGLGIMANVTLVDSDKEVDVNNLDETFALTGLGNSRNIVLFYEKGPVQMRVAQNQRDEFLQTLRNGTGGDPIFVEEYSQIDLSASYDINENFTMFFEGINVTGETLKSRGRFANHIVSLIDSGARYTVGVRATF